MYTYEKGKLCFPEMQICAFFAQKEHFLFQDFANNRNFAIFAPNMAYEVQ